MLKYLIDSSLSEGFINGRREFLRTTNEAEFLLNEGGSHIEDNVFDSVIAPLVVERFNLPETIFWFREVRRILKPGGEFILLSLAAEQIYLEPQRLFSCLGEDNPQLAFGYAKSKWEILDWSDSAQEKLMRALQGGLFKNLYPQSLLIKNIESSGLKFKAAKFPGNILQDSFVFQNSHLTGLLSSDLVLNFSHFVKPKVPEFGPDPWVSVCVPAHKPQFLRTTLKSALDQSYKNIEIIVSDDSSGDEIKTIVESLNDENCPRRISYHRCPVQDAEFNNIYALQLASGDFIKPLNDDDYLHCQSVEKLLALMLRFPEATLATSARVMIDSVGSTIPPKGVFTPIASERLYLDGQYASQLALNNGNFIGEPNCVLFRKRDFLEFGPKFFRLGNQGPIVGTPGDLQAWLNLLTRGDLLYLPEVLSYLRVHDNAISHRNRLNPEFGNQAWRRLREHARWLGIGSHSKPRNIRKIIDI